MRWDYSGDHWYEIAYWYLRSWLCDKVSLRCPSCREADKIEALEGETDGEVERDEVSIFVYGPMVPWFAWRPVDTVDSGWVWLRRVHRRRQATRADLPGPGGRWWQYWRYPSNHPGATK